MFHSGFYKIAGTLKSNISPEEYYDLKGEKDPYLGAILGAVAGAGVGAIKHKSHKAALYGTGLGAAAGASAGHLVGKANKALRMHLLRKEIEHLKLKANPGPSGYSHDSKEA